MNLESIESDEIFYAELINMTVEPQMIVFTHEWILDDPNVQKYMTWICQFAEENGIAFDFPEDRMVGEK